MSTCCSKSYLTWPKTDPSCSNVSHSRMNSAGVLLTSLTNLAVFCTVSYNCIASETTARALETPSIPTVGSTRLDCSAKAKLHKGSVLGGI